ncbi:MAG TPA: DUF736 domain-containing protein [Pseudaminobacter sp.]|nr:DUF736 domain-containing protein [Pseudaminobacter sp.]
MPQIGLFTRKEGGFFGNIGTLTLDAKLVIQPAREAGSGNAPDHRVFCDAAEVGAAWIAQRKGERLWVVIDDPSFTLPIRASLFRSDTEDGVCTLQWSRPSERDERGGMRSSRRSTGCGPARHCIHYTPGRPSNG